MHKRRVTMTQINKRTVFILQLLLSIAIVSFIGCSSGNVLEKNVADDTSITETDSSSNNNVYDTLGDTLANGQETDTDNKTVNKPGSIVARFPGAGTGIAGEPLQPGIGPETADECGTGTPSGLSTIISQKVECFYSADDLNVPAAAIEQIVEVVDDKVYIHLRLTLDPRFVDNSFGENAIGWEDTKKGEHTFKELVGSDHAEMKMYDADGNLVLHFKVDYVSEDLESASGYSSLGVVDGDGKMEVGEASSILGTATSLDRNLNGCELDTFTENSPASDSSYTPNAEAGEWDFRVVYEVWVDAAAFGDAGFGKAIIEQVHASPSKGSNNTIEVIPGDCPECDPEVEVCDPWIETDTESDTGEEIDTATDSNEDTDSATELERDSETGPVV